MKRTLIKTSLLFTLLPIFWGCVDKETDDPNNTLNGTLTALIDGEKFEADENTISAAYIQISDDFTSMAITAGQPNASAETKMIILAIVSGDGSGINVNETFLSSSLIKNSACQYTFNSPTVALQTHSDNTGIATVTITEIDMEEKTVSGTFNFKSSSTTDPEVVYEISEGIFTNISFE